MAVMCSHYYVAYPQFEVAEDDENEGSLRCTARMSSGRDLVEEFIGYGVWPLHMAGRWAKYALARCPPWVGNECEVQPSRWICVAGIPPHSCMKRKTGLCVLWGVMCLGQRPCGVGISVDPTFA
jgi:hypothetical protein